jgi:hypothetical protein
VNYSVEDLINGRSEIISIPVPKYYTHDLTDPWTGTTWNDLGQQYHFPIRLSIKISDLQFGSVSNDESNIEKIKYENYSTFTESEYAGFRYEYYPLKFTNVGFNSSNGLYYTITNEYSHGVLQYKE